MTLWMASRLVAYSGAHLRPRQFWLSLSPEFTRMRPDDSLPTIHSQSAQALTDIYDQFYPEIYRYVSFRLEDDQACEDIASEVFLRLLAAWGKAGRPIHNLRGWLFGTASHLVADYLRERYRVRMVWQIGAWEDLLAAPAPTLDEKVDYDWQRQSVRVALRRLTLDQQHVLALRFAETRSFEEIANVMGKSVGAVKNLQYRALGALRRELTRVGVSHD